jgi:hypothetical protein
MRSALQSEQDRDAHPNCGCGAREMLKHRAQMRGSLMAMNDFMPFLVMCSLAAAVYSLACWVGCWF